MLFVNHTKKIHNLEEKYKALSLEAFNLLLQGEERKSQKMQSQAQSIRRKILAYSI